MFILTTIADLVQIIPEDFRKRSVEAIEDNLNAKYSNKIIQGTGLAISVFDLLKVSDGHIGQDAGVVNVNVEFRLIVFRPFKGEIIAGRIKSSSEKGIKIEMNFFDDIFVPKNLLFEGSLFNVQDQSWVWYTNESQVEGHFYENNEPVRVRVESEEFHDNSPSIPGSVEAAEQGKTAPYKITASMTQAGLGPVWWWREDE